MASPPPKLRALCAVAILLLACSARSARGTSLEDTRGVPSDVALIQCETCDALVAAAVNETNKLPSASVTEVQLFDVVEQLCDPTTPSGHWAKMVDLVETSHALHLHVQTLEQECKRECRTLVLACAAVVDGAESELAERLYSLRRKGDVDAQVVSQWFCKGVSDACASDPPKMPADRPPGPPFVGRDPSKVQMEEMMERIKAQNQGMDVKMMNQATMGNMGAPNKDDDDDDDDDDNDDVDEGSDTNSDTTFEADDSYTMKDDDDDDDDDDSDDSSDTSKDEL